MINCGYPLIERFPLMLFTSAGVLLIGIIRWLLAMVIRPAATETAEADAASSDAQPTGLAGRLAPIFRMLPTLRRESADDETVDKTAKRSSRRTHAVGRSAKPARSSAESADSRRTGKRPATSRSRHIRPPLDAPADPTLIAPAVDARRAPASSAAPSRLVAPGRRAIRTCVVGRPRRSAATRTVTRVSRPVVAADSTPTSPTNPSHRSHVAGPRPTGHPAPPRHTTRSRKSGIAAQPGLMSHATSPDPGDCASPQPILGTMTFRDV